MPRQPPRPPLDPGELASVQQQLGAGGHRNDVGCGMFWFLSVSDGSLKLWDPNPLGRDDPPEQGILVTVPSLREWLEDWLAGRDRLLDEEG